MTSIIWNVVECKIQYFPPKYSEVVLYYYITSSSKWQNIYSCFEVRSPSKPHPTTIFHPPPLFKKSELVPDPTYWKLMCVLCVLYCMYKNDLCTFYHCDLKDSKQQDINPDRVRAVDVNCQSDQPTVFMWNTSHVGGVRPDAEVQLTNSQLVFLGGFFGGGFGFFFYTLWHQLKGQDVKLPVNSGFCKSEFLFCVKAFWLSKWRPILLSLDPVGSCLMNPVTFLVSIPNKRLLLLPEVKNTTTDAGCREQAWSNILKYIEL